MTSDPAPGTPKGDRPDILARLVQAYEARHFPIDAPDPRLVESALRDVRRQVHPGPVAQ
jgi:antitoxin component HigA of HigAB toxin-antitoxin module